jgi:hypothetical protein
MDNVSVCFGTVTVHVLNKNENGVLLEKNGERIPWKVFDSQYVPTETKNVYRLKSNQQERIDWMLPKLPVILIAITNKDDLKYRSYCKATEEYLDEYCTKFNKNGLDFMTDIIEAKKEIQNNVQ